ncbi:hypothetical protein PVAND_003864 [Polypedilum vanderplanki]|uniref:CBF1-interacting co-repressor CIR N-terminal domain-containing protein n=1 Tax=Polypedilum vanderplanki TaxID=319348 RepID=A0A9J6BWF7_POLVA|nr:hypothetical protein PVAND_003864 [Polypedilum vanderplanki]
MNILPHKSWHVRTRKNITRVREDEKKAAKEQEDRIQRIKLAEQEAKINLLRQRAQVNRKEQSSSTVTTTSNTQDLIISQQEHVNFFDDVEKGKYFSKEENEERAKEKKEEKEKYEKQVGYLTYLGQDTNEKLKKRDWYDTVPIRDLENKFDEEGKKIEVGLKSKQAIDPLNFFGKYTGTSLTSEYPKQSCSSKIETYKSVLPDKKPKKKKRSSSDSRKTTKSKHKHKKKHSKKHKLKRHKKHSSRDRSSSSSTITDSDDSQVIELRKKKMEILRKERLDRERCEREKANLLLAKARNEIPKVEEPTIKQTYNSQFMPNLARQNQ